ncbi:MAG TPA: FAD-binding protein, partial [Burkholderiaceae bacterium]|nr:FAD-binding protein [Burkholderiaceae bacterium]
MQSEKRRAFLTGRRQPLGEWGQFINRLSRRVSGDVLDFGYYDGVGSARLLPRCTADVRQARRLCAETNTKLVLAGVEQAQA